MRNNTNGNISSQSDTDMTLSPDLTLRDALFTRHSVRSFLDKALEEQAIKSVRSEISYATSRDASIHFQLITDDRTPFKGFTSSYGMFRNASNYVACVIDTSYPDCMIKAGFWGEMTALRAVSAGLGTCFVGGAYNQAKVQAQLRVTWKLPFIILLGYSNDSTTRLMARLMSRMAGSNRRPSAHDMLAPGSLPYEDIEHRWPSLIKPLESVACAPSSMNRRPVRICITESKNSEFPQIRAKLIKNYNGVEIDLGIAMANWQVCAGGEWDFGNDPLWIYP